jgi:Lon protease-like protein
MTDAERTVLPLFPLGTVLFPGLVLPLHIFEERYRELVRTLRRRPDAERVFGVVAIRHGWLGGEGGHGIRHGRLGGEGGPGIPHGWEVAHSTEEIDLYDVGCTAQIRDVTEHPDGTYDIVTVGRRRFAIHEMVDGPTPYAQATVTFPPERPGPPGVAEALGPRVLAAFRAYLRAYRTGAAGQEQLPEDPLVLSHLVAATASLSLAERQELLAAPDTATRLRDELRLLQREIALVARVRAVPAGPADLTVRPAPN